VAERAWIRGAQRGSVDDLERLFRAHWPRAYRAARLGDTVAAPAYQRNGFPDLGDLSPEHRVVIVLRFVLEYTPGEIADLLELPRGTVNSRLRRGLDHLKELQ